jgi:hypothetical protein
MALVALSTQFKSQSLLRHTNSGWEGAVKKRFTSGIVAIAKDEDPYLLEWIAYHLAIGVDHVWIYDNGSRTPISSLLSVSRSWRYVTVIRWDDVPNQNAQLEAYAHYLRTFGHAVEWTAAIDIDEFICLRQHTDINTFLGQFDHANGIAINWRYFGSAGHEHLGPGLVMERFTQASYIHRSHNQGIKSIYRTSEVERLMHHASLTRGARRVCSANGNFVRDDEEWMLLVDERNFDVAQINHYFVKSREEWDRKVRRGYGWPVEDRTHGFRNYDFNDVEDLTLLRWKTATQHWIRQIAAPSNGAVLASERVFGPLFRRVQAQALRKPTRRFRPGGVGRP